MAITASMQPEWGQIVCARLGCIFLQGSTPVVLNQRHIRFGFGWLCRVWATDLVRKQADVQESSGLLLASTYKLILIGCKSSGMFTGLARASIKGLFPLLKKSSSLKYKSASGRFSWNFSVENLFSVICTFVRMCGHVCMILLACVLKLKVSTNSLFVVIIIWLFSLIFSMHQRRQKVKQKGRTHNFCCLRSKLNCLFCYCSKDYYWDHVNYLSPQNRLIWN